MRGIGSVATAAAAACLIGGCATTTNGLVPAQPALTTAPGSFATATCPASLPTTVPTGYPYPTAPADAMVPGIPSHATVCRYEGGNDPHPNARTRSVTLAGAETSRLATALNAAPAARKGVAYPCPADFGVYDLVLFDYPTRAPVHVLVSLTGCGVVSNGHRNAMFAAAAIQQLGALVGAPSRPRG
jgi:hypothetical protein